ncbi:MAG: prenyltransferase/squalene oxidase repeat-containing protein [Bryobacteraceae bacterium]
MNLTRREFAASFAAAVLPRRELAYVEKLARPDGGYGWPSDPFGHLTPSFAAIACYRLAGTEPPRKAELVKFIRTHYPLPERRRKGERPLRRFDYEFLQGLAWLGEDLKEWAEDVARWTGPAPYTKQYERDGNPVFQHEVMSLLSRPLVGLAAATPEWRAYLASRRRPDGTFNNTPASDGTPGHVMNTWWGMQALEAMGERPAKSETLVKWLQACQRPAGGFTYQPAPQLAGIEELGYTWAAVRALEALGSAPARRDACVEWVRGLRNADGGYCDRPGQLSNLTATFYALDALRALGAAPAAPRGKPKAARSLPSGLHAFTVQIEAPGSGSPAEAVELARALRIHLWGAKNAAPGWVERCQEVADRRKAPVVFFPANEEYGGYVHVPGLGTYSHLSDTTAPPGVDFGAPMNDPKAPVPWPRFRDERIGALRKAGGAMIWQFNENEELTRILLDEAVERGTYAAIASFHFGNENFLNTQPFLRRYEGVLPFVALQDAHTRESWWWADQLAGFRTVFLAREPTWKGWMEALREHRVASIRHDAINEFHTEWGGGDEAVRRAIAERESEWRWWGERPDDILKPAASLVAVTPADKFEEARPESGVALRLRLRHRNTAMGSPAEPQAELIELLVDGAAVKPALVQKPGQRGGDRYFRYDVAARGRHTAAARVRLLASGREERVTAEFEVA